MFPKDGWSADTEKAPAMSATSRLPSCEEMLEPTIATAITPIVVIATECGGARQSAALARSLVTGPSSNGHKIDQEEQEQPADDRHMLQAGRQFVPELASVAEPEAMPEQSGGDRKAGQQQRAQPCKEARGHEKSADELSKDGGGPRKPPAKAVHRS